MQQRRHSPGFTLIELAVVLVLIALILGGVMMGQSMIRQAELRAVMTDVDRFIKATNQFRDKFEALPGDMYNATSYWGAKGVCPPAYSTTRETTTCNGNGDGSLHLLGSAAQYQELYLVWQHLANSGFAEGLYTGATASATGELVQPELNAPARVSGGYTLLNARGADTTDAANYFSTDYAHTIYYGAKTDTTLRATMGLILSGEEAYAIDAKFDDAIPSAGKAITFKNGGTIAPGCATSSTAYASSATTRVCAMMFKMGF